MIYFIQAKRHVKIGYSKKPEYRLAKMQTANPEKLKLLATMNGDARTEKGLHEALAKQRVRGEWFRYDGLLKACIQALNGKSDIGNPIVVEDVRSFQQAGLHLKARQKRNRLVRAGKPHHKFVKELGVGL
jgi:hypothetical protein